MDKPVLGGLLIVIVVVAVAAGVMVFNSMNYRTSGVDNQTMDNNSKNSDFSSSNTLLTFILFSPYISQLSLTPSPSPSPGPGPIPDPMDQVISLFDAYVESIFPQTKIPGSAIAIVQNEKIIYQKCLGMKDLSSGESVKPTTLFQINSCTKPFTATNIAQLIDNGTMSWDDPVDKYYNGSEFQLYDPTVTDTITLRDLLLHRSGLPEYSGDMSGGLFNDSFSTVLYKLRYIMNDTPFRSTWEYQNILYSLAGYCASRATNTTWSELVKQNLLLPLGMTTATTTLSDYVNSPDHTSTYVNFRNGTIEQYGPFNEDWDGPAGSIACSISEMANWLKFQVADTGTYNGIQIVSKKELNETHSGQIDVPIFSNTTYGFGWLISNTLFHDGDSLSTHSIMFFYPSKGLGIAIMTNEGTYGKAFISSLIKKLDDLLKGNQTSDPWSINKNVTRSIPDPVPPIVAPLSLGNYTGIYANQYGNLNITTYNSTLTCYFGNNSQSYDLVHWNGDVFEDKSSNFLFNFTDVHNGTAHQLIMNGGLFNRTNST
ncbi:MAG: serine hydrolase [Methanobacterium sp.]